MSGKDGGERMSQEALLAADIALAHGIASARDVAAALQRYWDEREKRAVSFIAELARIADLDSAARTRLEGEVARVLKECAGSARAAVQRRGGVDRSIVVELSRVGGSTAKIGADVRSPLRVADRDRYLDFRPIGAGGMGIVYLALDTELNRKVAFKIVRPDVGAPTEKSAANSPLDVMPPNAPDTPASEAFQTLTQRFLQEAWVTGALDHPGIVPVYELGQTPTGVPYYTMRFVRGHRTLELAIDAATTLDSRIALLEPFLKLCDTVRYAHSQGVIHRDLKPANVALGEFGEVVLLDWGLAKFREREDIALSQWQDRLQEYRKAQDLHTVAAALGTPGYMAPEAALGRSEEVDERSDVYSLGVVLYCILTQRLPYEFESYGELVQCLTGAEPQAPHEVDARVPEALSRICAAALRSSRATRTATAGALADGVRGWQRESARAREVEGLIREAETALAGIETLDGGVQVRQLDRVTTLAARILEMDPSHPTAIELAERAASQRLGAMDRRAALARRQTRRRVVGVATGVMVAGAVVAALLLDGMRREAEDARTHEAVARAAAEKAEGEAKASGALALKSLAEAERERDAKTVALNSLRAKALVTLAQQASIDHRPTQAFRLAAAALRVDSTDIDARRLLTESWQMPLETGGPMPPANERREFRSRMIQSGDVIQRMGYYSPTLRLINGSDGAPTSWAAFDVVSLQHIWPMADRILVAVGGSGWSLLDAAGHHVAHGRLEQSWPVGPLRGDATCWLSISDRGELEIRSGHDGSLLRAIDAHLGAVEHVESAAASRRIVSVGIDGRVCVWEGDGEPVGVARLPIGRSLTVLAIDATGTCVAAGLDDGTVRVWTAEGREVADLRVGSSAVSALTVLQGGRVVALSRDGAAASVTLGGGEVVLALPADGSRAVGLDAQTGRVLRLTGDGAAEVLEADGRTAARLPGAQEQFGRMRISVGGDLVGALRDDGVVVLWRVGGGGILEVRDSAAAIAAFDFLPEGAGVATANVLGDVHLRRVLGDGGATMLQPQLTPEEPTSLEVTPSGFVIQGRESGHSVWDPNGELVLYAQEGDGNRWDLPEDDALFSCSGSWATDSGSHWLMPRPDGVLLVDRRGVPLRWFRAPSADLAAWGISPDGSTIVTIGDRGTCIVWSKDGAPLAEFQVLPVGAPPERQAVAFDPCGERFMVTTRSSGIIYSRGGSHLLTVELAEGAGAGDRGAPQARCSWAPSGTHFALLGGEGYAVFRDDGSRVWAENRYARDLAWVGSGELAAVCLADDTVALVSLSSEYSHGSISLATTEMDGDTRICALRDRWCLATASGKRATFASLSYVTSSAGDRWEVTGPGELALSDAVTAIQPAAIGDGFNLRTLSSSGMNGLSRFPGDPDGYIADFKCVVPGSDQVASFSGGRFAFMAPGSGHVEYVSWQNPLALSVSSDGGRVAVPEGVDGWRILDGSGAELSRGARPSDPCVRAEFSPDGAMVALVTADGVLLVGDCVSGAMEKIASAAGAGSVNSAEFLSDTRLVVERSSGQLDLTDVKGGHVADLGQSGQHVVHSGSGRIWVRSSVASVDVHDTEGVRLARIHEVGGINSIEPRVDGSVVINTLSGRHLKSWSIYDSDGRRSARWDLDDKAASACLGATALGEFLVLEEDLADENVQVVSLTPGGFRVWVATGFEFDSLIPGTTRMLLRRTDDWQQAAIYDATQGLIAEIRTHEDEGDGHVSVRGATLAWLDATGEVVVADASGNLRRLPTPPDLAGASLRLSPAGRRLLIRHPGGAAVLVDVETAVSTRLELPERTGAPYFLTERLLRSSTTVAADSTDFRERVFDLRGRTVADCPRPDSVLRVAVARGRRAIAVLGPGVIELAGGDGSDRQSWRCSFGSGRWPRIVVAPDGGAALVTVGRGRDSQWAVFCRDRPSGPTLSGTVQADGIAALVAGGRRLLVAGKERMRLLDLDGAEIAELGLSTRARRAFGVGGEEFSVSADGRLAVHVSGSRVRGVDTSATMRLVWETDVGAEAASVCVNDEGTLVGAFVGSDLITLDGSGKIIGRIPSVAPESITMVSIGVLHKATGDGVRTSVRLFTPDGGVLATLPLQDSDASPFVTARPHLVTNTGEWWMLSTEEILAAARRAGIRDLEPNEVPALSSLLDSQENEHALLRAVARRHRPVLEEAARAVAGAPPGEAERALEAFVVAHPGTELDDWLRALSSQSGDPAAAAAYSNRHPRVWQLAQAVVAKAAPEERAALLRLLIASHGDAPPLAVAAWRRQLAGRLDSQAMYQAAAQHLAEAARDYAQEALARPLDPTPSRLGWFLHVERARLLAKHGADLGSLLPDVKAAALAADAVVRRGYQEWGARAEAWRSYVAALQAALEPSGVSRDRLSEGYMFYELRLYGDAARSLEAAIADASVRGDLVRGNLYNAACSASLAAKLGGEHAEGWKSKAFAWLEADLALRAAEARGIEDQLSTALSRTQEADLRSRLATSRRHFEHFLRGDMDLAPIRSDERWKELVKSIK